MTGDVGFVRIGDVVVLSGRVLEMVADLATIGATVRERRDAMPLTPQRRRLLQELRDAAFAPSKMSASTSAPGHDSADIALSPAASGQVDDPLGRAASAAPLTTAEAARRLDITGRQVRRLVDELGGVKAGNQWLFTPEAVDDEARRRGREPQTEKP